MTLTLTIILGILIGLFTGICSGLFGIGGGLVSIPLMHVVLGIPGEVAIGTSLFLIIPTTMSGAFVYHKKKMMDVKTGAICGVAGIPTAMLGAYVSSFLSGKILMLMFSALLVGIGIKMLLHKKKPAGNAEERKIDSKYIISACVIGAIVGFLSGLLGIGGGFLLTPAFLIVLGLSMHEAIGTSLLTIAIYGIPGAIMHALLGNTDFFILALLLAGAIIGPQIGARLCICTKAETMKKLMVGFLFFMAAYLALKELGVF